MDWLKCLKAFHCLLKIVWLFSSYDFSQVFLGHPVNKHNLNNYTVFWDSSRMVQLFSEVLQN